jgi:hypothetical protein
MQSCEPNLVPRESGPSAAQTPLKPTSGATVEEEENDSPEYMVTPRISVVEHYVGPSEAAKFLSIHSRTLTQMAREVISQLILWVTVNGECGDSFYRS